jgi:hypothetical protein
MGKTAAKVRHSRLGARLGYAIGIFSYLGTSISLADAGALVRQQISRREQNFLDLVERAIYANPVSPYRRLLRHAGFELRDVRALVESAGLEGALGELYSQGIYVSQDEFKGRQPIKRPGLEFAPAASDFNNPIASASYPGQSSGTRGVPSRVQVDLDHLGYEGAQIACFMDAHDVRDNPIGLWRPAPPDSSGMNALFRYARSGRRTERWFSQRRFAPTREMLQSWLLLEYTLVASRLAGLPFPRPEFVPRDRAVTVARWMAEKKRAGTPAFLDSSASPAVRVCLAAAEHGLDISGSVFRIGGEPFTPAKAQVIAAAGGRVINRYSTVELGIAGLGCAAPNEIDDLHLAIDKVAAISRERPVGQGGTTSALILTSLHATPKLMLNTDTGDGGSLAQASCGCPLHELGYTTVLTGLGGYDKLTSEGVTFLGRDLYRLVEEVLPGRFGGHPTDYQLVEQEDESGLPRVGIYISPSVGSVEEDAALAEVIQWLATVPAGGSMMADQWRQAGTLHVVRREPYASGRRKIYPLHVMRGSDSSRKPERHDG